MYNNRLALFTSPFEITVFPALDRCRIDLMGSLDFESTFVAYKEIGNQIIGLAKPNVIQTWNQDTGHILLRTHCAGIDITNYRFHSEWHGQTILKKTRDVMPVAEKQAIIERNAFVDSEDDIDDGSEDFEDDEEKMEQIYEHLTTFSIVEIQSSRIASEKCRFMYEWKQGINIYTSYPYVLVFDGNSAKMFKVKGDRLFKKLIPVATFIDEQCKQKDPVYFSPDFLHRIYINEEKEIVISYTLDNIDLIKCDFRKQIMFQKKKTNPMFYFHSNDQIVYLSKAGVEKLFRFVKLPDRNKHFINCYLEEISSISYNEK